MRKAILPLALILVVMTVEPPSPVFAAYRLSTTTAYTWDGTYADRF
jgi:hypothetical protein